MNFISRVSAGNAWDIELNTTIKFIYISEYVIFCLLYKHQWNTKSACFQRRDLLCNHNDGDLFTCEDNMLSSHVKIWSFRGRAQLVFHWYFPALPGIINAFLYYQEWLLPFCAMKIGSFRKRKCFNLGALTVWDISFPFSANLRGEMTISQVLQRRA